MISDFIQIAISGTIGLFAITLRVTLKILPYYFMYDITNSIRKISEKNITCLYND